MHGSKTPEPESVPASSEAHLVLHQGLGALDDHIDALLALWEELRLVTCEAAEADLVSFAQSACFFGVVLLERDWPVDEDAGIEYENAVSEGMEEGYGQLGRRSPGNFEANWTESGESQGKGADAQNEGLHFVAATSQSSKQSDLSPKPDIITVSLNAKPAKPYSAIGIVYLTLTPLGSCPPKQVGELNLGIIIDQSHRRKSFANRVLEVVLNQAFNDIRCHRVQANLLGAEPWGLMFSLLLKLGFGHEGTKRRAFFHPVVTEWQDLTTMGVLATDWLNRGRYKPAPTTLWDELFLRHSREREALLKWDDSHQHQRKRSNSTETVRYVVPLVPESECSSTSDAEWVDTSPDRSDFGERRSVGLESVRSTSPAVSVASSSWSAFDYPSDSPLPSDWEVDLAEMGTTRSG